MPKGFDSCRAKGGKIRITKPSKDTYLPICYIGKKSFRGYVHKIKGNDGDVASAIKARKG